MGLLIAATIVGQDVEGLVQKSKTYRSRSRQQDTHDDLVTLSASSFAPSTGTELGKTQLTAAWQRHKGAHSGRPKAIWDDAASSLLTFLYHPAEAVPVAACQVRSDRILDNDCAEVRFTRELIGVFNDDVAVCDDMLSSWETWEFLAKHRFERAVSRFVSFKSVKASYWLRLMQDSMSLTYESQPVRHSVVFWQRQSPAKAKVSKFFVPFGKPMELELALLEEKWVRAVIDGQRAVLVSNERGNAIGMLSLEALAYEQAIDAEALPPYAPHARLLPLQYSLGDRDMALVMSPTGDLYVMTGRGVFFHKSQGAWSYMGLSQAEALLADVMDEESVTPLLRMALDLSYEKKGALLCVLDAEADVAKLVTDHAEPRANALLRASLRSRRIDKWAERQILAAAASTDGATLLSRSGRLIDVACLISSSQEQQVKALGFTRPRVFPGARSTATWFASLYGTALKISEDGPISIWRHGQHIGSID